MTDQPTPTPEATPAAQPTTYAHPERLVSTDWVAQHLNTPGVVIVESDEDVLLYETGHIPGAVKIDWHTELNDPVTRDYLDGAGFATLMRAKGIARTDSVVIYGDKSNWWAAYALWVFTLFGHEDVRLMDGGRQLWQAQGRELTREKPTRTPTDYPVVDRDDTQIRAFLPQVRDHIRPQATTQATSVTNQATTSAPTHQTPNNGLIDVRSQPEYTGERTHMPDYPEEGALRGGHIPTALSVPWATAANEDGTFKSREELTRIYLDNLGLDTKDDVITYCRIGERSSHTWFVLTHLLGLDNVRNYDGSWTEWGNVVGVPITQGDAPGDPQ